MKAFFGLLAIYVLINAFVIGLGLGIGFLLHRLIPSIELGASVLAGIFSTGLSIHYFFRLLRFIGFLEPFMFVDDEEDDDSPPVMVYPQITSRPSRKRKRK
jgi:hypothetical protein